MKTKFQWNNHNPINMMPLRPLFWCDLSVDFSLQMMRLLDVMHLKYTIEFRVTVCPCVYVKTSMFMKAKSKNGQYVSPSKS